MALLVTADTPTPIGTTVPSLYWRWVGLGIDVTTASATVTLHGYVSAAAFAAKAQPVATKQVTLAGADFLEMAVAIETPSNPGLSQVIYAKVKALEGFAGATDA